MPRPKRIDLVTVAPAHSTPAIDEWTTGIEIFIEWANRARTGETSEPFALEAAAALSAFSEGRFQVPFSNLPLEFVLAGKNVLTLVRNSHWHLVACPLCNRWMLVKDRRRALCRRTECLMTAKKQQKQSERKARRDLDRGAVGRARRTF